MKIIDYKNLKGNDFKFISCDELILLQVLKEAEYYKVVTKSNRFRVVKGKNFVFCFDFLREISPSLRRGIKKLFEIPDHWVWRETNYNFGFPTHGTVVMISEEIPVPDFQWVCPHCGKDIKRTELTIDEYSGWAGCYTCWTTRNSK